MDRRLRSSLSRFATRFCNELGKEQSSVCSPLSCEILLALTALGSAGDSRAELLKAMDLPDDDAIRSSFALVSSSLKSVKGVTLRLGNKVYVTKNGTLKPSIKKDAKKVLDSGLEQLDFMEKDAAAEIINNWVAVQTNNKIKDIVSPESLTDDTRLLLVNAIYFQGNWDTPFNKRCTTERTFHVNNTKSFLVPMMYMDDVYFKYKHSSALKAKLLQMPYKGHQSSMVFVLPDEVEGLEEIMRRLAAGFDLIAEIDSMEQTEVDVMIPKFKIETEIDLKDLLRKMGIETLFDESRSGIRMLTSTEHLVVAQAVQKAIIEVDELGTEAAVCTLYRMKQLCLRYNERFIANHPFLYLVQIKHIPLFIGIHTGIPNPLSKSDKMVETSKLKRRLSHKHDHKILDIKCKYL